MVETIIFYNYELNFPSWVLYQILKLGLGYNDVKVSDTIMLLICPVQGWQIVYSVLEKNPCALLLNRSTLHSGHLFIGPKSDHWLCLSLPNSLTDCCLVNLSLIIVYLCH